MGDFAPAGMFWRANVQVQALLGNEYIPDADYTGKINTLISDVRVGRHVVGGEAELYAVAVPDDSVLNIEVERKIRTPNQGVSNHLEVLRFDNREPSHKISHQVDGHQVAVSIDWENNNNVAAGPPAELFTPAQPHRPVKVEMVDGRLTLVYTIGDEISFMESITALRRILADHPGREDILDGHDLLNLAATREHPVLPRNRAGQLARWIHVKLQVVKKDEITASTTLIMRGDTLYVLGFINNAGRVYGLVDDMNKGAGMLPVDVNGEHEKLAWTVKYSSILGVGNTNEVARELAEVVAELGLGRTFAVEAVHRLSSSIHHPNEEVPGMLTARRALAGLIMIVSESARINPIHDAFARGWIDGTGFDEQLMQRCAWQGRYGELSSELQTWKNTRIYGEPHCCSQLQDIHLVVNNPGGDRHKRKGGRGRKRGGKGGNTAGSSSDPHKKQAGDRSGDGSGSQPEVGGDAGHSASGNQPAGDPSQPSEVDESQGYDQTCEEEDSDGSSEEDDEQPGEADGAQSHGRGRPMVGMLSMRANHGVIGKRIIVFDGKRGQIIYRNEKQGGQEIMEELVLTGPYARISAYGCFAIHIDKPDPKADPITWEWDCYKNYAHQVDNKKSMEQLIFDDATNVDVAKVTYAVMSNAREATVRVRLRLKDGQRPAGVSGKITGRIDGFDGPNDLIVLFSRTEVTDKCLSRTDDDSWFLLQLSRSLVAVPCGKALHIKLDGLKIETTNGQGPKSLNVPLKFDNGTSSQSVEVDGNEVEVNITWYPEIKSHPPKKASSDDEEIYKQNVISTAHPEPSCLLQITSHPPKQTSDDEQIDKQNLVSTAHQEPSGLLQVELEMISLGHQPDVVYTIGDEGSFIGFTKDLRRCLANHPDKEKFMGTKVLAKQRAEQPARWIHVKMQAVVEGDEETSWTTLIMRDDDLYVHGFLNQQGVCYELLETKDSVHMLPENEYNPQPLYWGIKYRTILDVQDGGEAMAKLVSEGLGKSFAIKAVHRLSSSIHHPDDQVTGILSAKLALAGLIVMVCESARFNPIRDALEAGWNSGTGLTERLMDSYVQRHVQRSRELQAYKSRNSGWLEFAEVQATYLVLNTWPMRDSNIYRTRWNRYVPRVELLSIRADLGVVGTKIIVSDGKRGQIIYRHEEQGEKEMVDLVLNPYTAISVCGCVAIKIDIPASAPIKWEWDCYRSEYADQVDKPPATQKIGNVAKVTYAVMSDALEATVQVKLRLNDGHSPSGISGEITALIDGFEDEGRSVLFRHAKRTGQCISSTGDSMFLLQLGRNVLAVPHGKVLHIKVALEIETSNNQGIKHLKADLHIANGILSLCNFVDGGEVEVNITWFPEVPEIYPKPKGPPHLRRELVYTIGDDEMSYIGFIMAIRRSLADHPEREDILDRYNDSDLSSTGEHPVLSQQRMWLHIVLQVAGHSTTLAIQYDGLFLHSFMNQGGDWYFTSGGEHCKDKMNVEDAQYIKNRVDSVRVGKTFAADAVGVLSRYSKGTNAICMVDGEQTWQALATLKVMVCDSAKINHVRDAIAAGWKNETRLTVESMDKIKNWERISRALLQWKESRYGMWKEDEKLKRIGIKVPEDALNAIHLCWAPREMQRSYRGRSIVPA